MSIQSEARLKVTLKEQTRLWNGMVGRFMEEIRTWKLWYAAAFAMIGIVANIAPAFDPAMNNPSNDALQAVTPGYAFFLLSGLLYILLSLGAIPILGWTFSKSLRSGQRLLAPSEAVKQRYSRSLVNFYRGVRTVFIYIVVPVIVLGLFSLFGVISYLLSPHFASDQHVPSAAHHILKGALMALLASLEELWRWALIAAVLYAAKSMGKRSWRQSSNYRRWSFAIAILISSFFFGMAHIAEFNLNYRWMALLVLGGSGLVFAGIAILTRRLWIAMLVHAVYDFLAMTQLFSIAAPWLLIGMVLGLAVVLPLFYQLYRRLQIGYS